jgi:uncharacterized protein (DUF2336 family)
MQAKTANLDKDVAEPLIADEATSAAKVTPLDLKPSTSDNMNQALGMLSSGLGAAQKARLAQQVGKNFSNRQFEDLERKIAEKIFLVLASDAEVSVRKTLAETLKNNQEIPRELAVKLASDVIEVAEPILVNSKVLEDADLIEIIRISQNTAHRLAISLRDSISKEVTGSLVEHEEEEVIRNLVANKGAEFTEQMLLDIMDTFAGSSTILESLVKRGDIPLTTVEKMLTKVSGDLRRQLVERHNIDEQVAERLIDSSREFATLDLIYRRKSGVSISEVIEQLQATDQLKPSLILRALCIGDFQFFEAAMAALAGVPLENARILIRDRGERGFKAIYKSSKLPMSVYEAVKVVVMLGLEETGNGTQRISNFQQRMLERILSQGYNDGVDNMSYMMALIGNNIGSQFNTVH